MVSGEWMCDLEAPNHSQTVASESYAAQGLQYARLWRCSTMWGARIE